MPEDYLVPYAILFSKTEAEEKFGHKIDSIDLNRLKKNPVMLDFHRRGYVIGRWEQLTTDQEYIYGVPVFDEGSLEGEEAKRQWDKDFKIAISIGYDIENGICVPFEGSIVDIGMCESATKVSKTASEKKTSKVFDNFEKKVGFTKKTYRLAFNNSSQTVKRMTAQDHKEQKDMNPAKNTDNKTQTNQSEPQRATTEKKTDPTTYVASQQGFMPKQSGEHDTGKTHLDISPEYKAQFADIQKKLERLEKVQADRNEQIEQEKLSRNTKAAKALHIKAQETGFPGVSKEGDISPEFLATYLANPKFLTESVQAHIKAHPKKAFQPNPDLQTIVNSTKTDGGASEDPEILADRFLSQMALSENRVDVAEVQEGILNSFYTSLKNYNRPMKEKQKDGYHALNSRKGWVPPHHKEAWDKISQEAHFLCAQADRTFKAISADPNTNKEPDTTTQENK